MATPNSAGRYGFNYNGRAGKKPLYPRNLFVAAIFMAAALWIAAAFTLPSDLVLPLVSAYLFISAVLMALMAWQRGRVRDPHQITYWDVAGALTLIGICVTALVEPDQMVRLVEGAHRND
jgi:hypothetical protein